MKILQVLFILLMLTTNLFAQNPVLLQPWVEVFGDTNGMQLGSQVTGFIPNLYFPYKAGVTKSNKTGLYKLQNQSDKSPYGFVLGENVKQADLNGDKNLDLILRIPGEFYVTPDTVKIYWGRENGLDSVNTTKIIGEDRKDVFGVTFCVGNVIGDSITDLVITAPGFSQGSGQGKIYIYKGAQQFITTPNLTILGDSVNYYYGWNCSIGKLNSDNYNDLIIQGVYQNGVAGGFKYIDVYFGGVSFDTLRDIRIAGNINSQKGIACFDVNGDGIHDLLWTNRDSADWIYVHYGGNNFSTSPSLRLKDPGFSEYGGVIINAGDMNGDGYNDIAVGADHNITTGYVYIYGGGPKINAEYDAYYSKSLASYFGKSISSIGDINGDGLCDLIVGAPEYPFGENKGYWGIFLGNINIKVTSVKNEESRQPQFFEVYQNYPNPFNGQTVITYRLITEANVNITITNTLGQTVTTIAEGEKQQGTHQRILEAKYLASGWYVYTISITPKNSSQTFTQSRAMILER